MTEKKKEYLRRTRKFFITQLGICQKDKRLGFSSKILRTILKMYGFNFLSLRYSDTSMKNLIVIMITIIIIIIDQRNNFGIVT